MCLFVCCVGGGWWGRGKGGEGVTCMCIHINVSAGVFMRGVCVRLYLLKYICK